MRRCLWLLVLPLLLTACNPRTGAPTTANTGPASKTTAEATSATTSYNGSASESSGQTAAPTGSNILPDPTVNPGLEANCPPPSPPEPPFPRPAPMYVRFGVRGENPALAPGQPLQITAYLKNVAPFAIVLDPRAPVLELRRQENAVGAPVWSLPLTNWAGITLRPEEEVTQSGTWPGGEQGYYRLNFDRIHYIVACIHASPVESGGGTQVHVLLPAGQAMAGTLTPRTAVTVDDITVRVDSIVMDPKGTQITLWVSGIRAPADLSVTVYADGKILDGVGQANRAAEGGGVVMFDNRAPLPLGTKSLTVEVSDIGLTTPGVGMTRVHGPWQIKVPLVTGP